MDGKDESLSPDFQNGMLAGYAEGLMIMQWLLIEAVKDTASTAPGTSAFLKGLTEGMGKDFPELMASYHEAKGLSVPLNISVVDEDRIWN